MDLQTALIIFGGLAGTLTAVGGVYKIFFIDRPRSSSEMLNEAIKQLNGQNTLLAQQLLEATHENHRNDDLIRTLTTDNDSKQRMIERMQTTISVLRIELTKRRPSPLPPDDDTRPAILILEDQQFFRVLWEKLLRSAFGDTYEIFRTASMSEAVEYIQLDHPIIAIVDLNLDGGEKASPAMAGIDFLEILTRESPETQILVISAFGETTHGEGNATARAIAEGYGATVLNKLNSTSVMLPVVKKLINSANLGIFHKGGLEGFDQPTEEESP